MVLAHVEDRRRVGGQRVRRLQLEAGEFEHPDGGRGRKLAGTVLDRHQRVKRRRRDVAARHGRHAGGVQDMRGQRRRRRLAVAAGDGDDLRGRVHLANAPAEQLDLGDDRHATCHCRPDLRFLHRDAGRDGDQIDAGKGLVGERTAAQRGTRHCAAQRIDVRRLRAAVGDAHPRALPIQPFGHRQPGLTEAEDENRFILELHVSESSTWTNRPAPA